MLSVCVIFSGQASSSRSADMLAKDGSFSFVGFASLQSAEGDLG